MKRFLKLIFWLPKMLLSLIWRMVWSFLQTLVILFSVIFALLYYANHSDSKLANEVSNLSHRVISIYDYFKQNEAQTKPEKGHLHQTDQVAHVSGIRWQSNQATVYIEATHPVFVNAYRATITNWNKTGTFQFTIVDDFKRADIIAKETNDSTMEVAGLAKVESQEVTKIIRNASVYLNAYYLLDPQYDYSSERIVHTAEHELGHAIGLEHEDEKPSVMKSSGSYLGIQKRDMEKVQALYQ
ncbi:matrixin family metalloprotease [Streptococcus iniae]|uniref:matrixin family metalloprotease n=1 Tax=Streptococcus iniae TaxID=1346 RepID=UPI002B298C9B|nr:matrixin family metalloprotease [Streptococcus iniae]WNZ90523.1 matrixin family metalloprotease [Streptococcus iniae]WNZ92159.1 matrixin family metalloprotease [Streptococcus iniae]WNZ93559.1 matrixin family metalloprotease [Streptococcus iniae]WNZ94790.1 matrixin family metalloprotease [Streptococcus iniae]